MEGKYEEKKGREDGCNLRPSITVFDMEDKKEREDRCDVHDWGTKGCGMCYPVCGMMHLKEPLLLIGKSRPCSDVSGFPLSLSEWSFTICLMPYNRK